MRVRDKRKQQKEQKAQKQTDKQKLEDSETKPTTVAAAAATKTTTTVAAASATARTTTTIQTTAPPQQPPTLPATEKVAFDNRIKRKNVLALNEKVAALREYDRQPVYKHVGRMFNCSPDQIKRIVQQRDEILRAWEQRTRRSQDAKTQELKVVRVSMLGKAVYDWIRRMMYYKDFIISDGLIQKMALQFKSSMGLNNFFPHQEWCDKFRNTYNIQHNDTKLLKFGYTQSYSVQINDIAKDVMAQCQQSASTDAGADDENDLDVSLPTVSAASSHGEDDDEGDVDIDGGGDLTDPSEDEDSRDVKPSISELQQQQQQTRVLQPLPQLVRLPQVPPGTSQKVLLATPILPPGATPSGAQTMTIIPLATLAQSITQRPSVPLQPKASGMPPPMLDIKQEIKAEPKDTDEEEEQQQQQQDMEPEPAKAVEEPAQPKPVEEEEEETPVHIKQELDSDGEALDEDEDDTNGGRCSVTSLAEILAANVDDEKQYIEQQRAMRHRKRTPSPAKDLSTPLTILPPMPTLIKAPTSLTPPAKRPRHAADDNNNAGGATGQSIITCAEARKYLKQLEEFALYKENYRLIELFTRADEVMRELADE